MKGEHGTGSVKAVRNAQGTVTAWRALLPRELSSPPAGAAPGYQAELGRYSSKEEARSMLAAAIAQILEGRSAKSAGTIEGFIAAELRARHQEARRKYTSDAKANRIVSTWKSIDRRWLSQAKWYQWQPDSVTAADLQGYVDWLRDEAEGASGEPLSGHFIRNVVRLLGAALDRAKLPANPARGLDLPKKEDPKVAYMDLLTQERLLQCGKLELSDRVMIGCGMGAGLRVGELLSIEADDVMLDGARPHLMVRYGGAGHSPPKSGEPRRVELFEPGLGFWKLWMGRFYAQGSTMVFAGPAGGYQKAWPEQFPGWAEAAGTKRLSSHIMRHSYAVAMLSGTWGYEPRTLEFVSAQLGHADLQTTQRYYAAYEAGTWSREVERMTGALPQAFDRGSVVTAFRLLGLKSIEAAIEAKHSKNLDETGVFVLSPSVTQFAISSGNTAHSEAERPQAPETPKTELSGPEAEALYDLAIDVLTKAATGDPTAVAAGIALAQRVVELRRAAVPGRTQTDEAGPGREASRGR